jgi:hypothetical protein
VSELGELSEDAIVRFRGERPERGWRGMLYRLTGGLVNPGLGAAERTRRDQLRRIGRPLPGAGVTVAAPGVGPPGGAAQCAGPPLGLALRAGRGPACGCARRRQEAASRVDQQIGAFSWQSRGFRATPLITASGKPCGVLTRRKIAVSVHSPRVEGQWVHRIDDHQGLPPS